MNLEDINNITKKLGYSLEKDLWPNIEYTDGKEEDEEESNSNSVVIVQKKNIGNCYFIFFSYFYSCNLLIPIRIYVNF